jgi:hypothetical protein
VGANRSLGAHDRTGSALGAGNLVTNMRELKGIAGNETTWADATADDWTKAKPGRPSWTDTRSSQRPILESPTILIIDAGQFGLIWLLA